MKDMQLLKQSASCVASAGWRLGSARTDAIPETLQARPALRVPVSQQAHSRHASQETSSSCPSWVMVLWTAHERRSVKAAEALIRPKESLRAPLLDSIPHALASVPDRCTHQGGLPTHGH